MATAFPTGLDSFLNPAGSDKLNNAVNLRKHSIQHGNVNDAVAAIEAKVGIDGSAVTSSFDYRIDALENAPAPASSSVYGAIPPMNGYLDWTGDPATMGGQAYLTVSGTMQGQAWKAAKSQNLTTITYWATNAGTATAAYACLYTAAGALIVQSATAHAQFGSAGLKNFTIASTPVVAETIYYVCVWLVTASAPSFYCALGVDGDIFANANRSAANLRTFTANTGLAGTAPTTIGARTAARMPWVAFS